MTGSPIHFTRRSRKRAVLPCFIPVRPVSDPACRGGNGMRLKYSNPMYMDDVAVDFPDLKIILAHPSFPWQEEALAVAQHKPNVYIDLSGWSPKYFPEILVRYCNSILKKKVLFGSDWPMITPERWLADFEQIAIKDDLREDIIKGNAAPPAGVGLMKPFSAPIDDILFSFNHVAGAGGTARLG